MNYIKVIIITVLFASCYSKDPQKTGLEGQLMPSFKLLQLDSSTYFDTKDIPIGKPTVLLYIGPNCPYSKTQIQEIIEDINKLKSINFYVFTSWPFKEMKQLHDHFHLDQYPNITTGIDFKYFFEGYFEAQGVPYMAIYGKDKKLNKVFVGKVYGKQIKEVALR